MPVQMCLMSLYNKALRVTFLEGQSMYVCEFKFTTVEFQGCFTHYLQLKLLSGKNVRAWVSMDFTQDKFSAPIAIEKIKILGAPWELLAKQHCQSSPFTSNFGQIGQIGSAV